MLIFFGSEVICKIIFSFLCVSCEAYFSVPQRPNHVCRSCGKVDNNELVIFSSSTFVKTEKLCADLCLNHPKCNAYEWHGDWNNKECFLCNYKGISCSIDIHHAETPYFRSGICPDKKMNSKMIGSSCGDTSVRVQCDIIREQCCCRQTCKKISYIVDIPQISEAQYWYIDTNEKKTCHSPCYRICRLCSDTNPRPVCGGFLHGKCPEGHYCTNHNEGLFGSCIPFRFHFPKDYQNVLDSITSVSSNNVLKISSILISLILFVLLCCSMKLVHEKYRSPTRKQVSASEYILLEDS